MDKDTFTATIVMLGWKKIDTYQYYKYINKVYTLILCRDNGALMIANTIRSKDDLNEYLSYNELLKQIYEDKL